MGIDSNIILQGRTPELLNPLDVASKTMNMKRMMQEGQVYEDKQTEKQNISDIFKRNAMTDADGKASINHKSAISDLYKVNPEKAMSWEKEWNSHGLEKQKLITEQAKQFAWALNRDNYTDMRAEKIQSGFPNAEKMPEVYSERFVKNFQMMTLNAEEQMKYKSSELANEKTRIDTSKTKAEIDKINRESSSPRAKLSDGQKSVDKKFAEDYNNWTSGGGDSAKLEIKKLKDVSVSLAKKKVTTGALTGMFPDRITSDKVLSARSDVQSTIMNSLRQILGSAFTEKEGERVIKNTWNEADTTENNLKRINRLVENLESSAIAKDNKASYFEQNNSSLIGFKAPQGSTNQETMKTNEIEWAD